MQDTSTNLSKLQREHLLDICSKIKKQEPVEIVEIVELEQFIKSMKYGLNFEKHEEPVDRMLRTHIPVFKEFKEVINNPESADCNFLLEGDNLHSLKLLEKTHKGRIDVCYIDPPYNTLNEDFVYGDKMLDENDGFVHSKWLSFMKERLEIARKLLADDGVIFISIDDREQAQLKLLCDEVFGEENFISNIVWKKGGGKSDAKYLSNKKEYVLAYRKSEKTVFNKSKSPIDNYKLVDENNRRYCLSGFARQGLTYTPTLDYPIEAPDGTSIYPGKSKELYIQRQNGNFKNRDWCWTLSKNEFNKRKDAGDIVFKKIKGNYQVYYKSYYEGKVTPYDDIYEEGGNQVGAAEIKNVFSGVRVFDFPKNTTLLKFLIRLHPNKEAIILDFFAGSGTTGHAVMDLNKEDGGNRHFILCTNNEVSTSKYLDYIHSKSYMEDVKTCGKSAQSKINKFFEDNPDVYKKLMVGGKNDYETYGICQSVTFPRLNTVITGIRPDGTKYSDGITANLRYFQTDMIAKNDEDLDELLYEASFCLAELDCMSRIDNKTIRVAECDEDVDEIIQNATDDLKTVFVAYDVFFDAEQQDFFDRHHIETKRIPDCYYIEY